MAESILNQPTENAPSAETAAPVTQPEGGVPNNDAPNGETKAPQPAEGLPPTEKAPDTKPAEGAQPQSDDWATTRTKIAGTDEKVLKRLSRYGTLEEALKAGVEAQSKLDAVRATKPINKESTPEEVKAYREANNIPENAADYKIELPDGLVLGEEDKPVADSFMELAHKNNLRPELVNEVIGWNLKLREEMMQQVTEADNALMAETVTTLKSPDGWGSEYQTNINRINALLDASGDGVKDLLWNARLGDGTLLGNNAKALQFLDGLARQTLPLATITPAYGKSQVETAQAELAALQKEMGDSNSGYWKGPMAAHKQSRALELNEIMLNVKK